MEGSSAEAAKPAPMWKQDESGRVQTPLEPVVLVATLALIPVRPGLEGGVNFWDYWREHRDPNLYGFGGDGL
jgi:hypothetical protein